jgi:ABC-2 type transport system ATP-binding protein
VLLGRLAGLGRKAARGRAAELITAFGLEAAAARQVKSYSGGMRRRLDLAASILVRADVYFLDEPTTGLDPASRARVWDLVRALAGGGATVLLTTQYLDEADQLASRVAVIDHGRLVAEGTPGQLKASAAGRDGPRQAGRPGATAAGAADPGPAARRPRPGRGRSGGAGSTRPGRRPGRRRAVRAGRPGHRGQ